jgi:hypothetical protein
MALRKGDIVRYEDSPCEVLCVFRSCIFLMNKRTLNCDFVSAAEVEYVRSPSKDEFKRGVTSQK